MAVSKIIAGGRIAPSRPMCDREEAGRHFWLSGGREEHFGLPL